MTYKIKKPTGEVGLVKHFNSLIIKQNHKKLDVEGINEYFL